ncbi:hypothetical protein HDU97_008716 [Phlyctochytrium planicorne]|nr:hypothetical protein HDU97_008716 [Phlyctochytrium planicorne]
MANVPSTSTATLTSPDATTVSMSTLPETSKGIVENAKLEDAKPKKDGVEQAQENSIYYIKKLALMALVVLVGVLCVMILIMSFLGQFRSAASSNLPKSTIYASHDIDELLRNSSSTFPPRSNHLIPKSKLELKGLNAEEFYSSTCSQVNIISVKMSIVTVDLSLGVYKMKLDMSPCGDFVDPEKVISGKTFVLGGVAAKGIRLNIDSKSFQFSGSAPMQSQEFTANFDDGDLNWYPFDSYKAIDLYLEGDFFNVTSNTTEPLPMQLIFDGKMASYNVWVPFIGDVTSSNEGHGLILALDFTIARSAVIILFSIVVMGIMWTLSLLGSTLSITLWLSKRTVEPATVGFSIALM